VYHVTDYFTDHADTQQATDDFVTDHLVTDKVTFTDIVTDKSSFMYTTTRVV